MKEDMNRKLQLLVSVITEPDEFGIFVNNLEASTHGRLDYANLNLSDELVARFKFWQKWYWDIRSKREKIDWKTFESYGLALAIDLKLFLGNENYHVSYEPGIKKDAIEEEIIIKSPDGFPELNTVTNYWEMD